MIGVFPASPFSRESFASAFGFPVPLPFVTFLNALCQDCATSEAVYDRFADVFEWDLASEEQRYQQTPPELFPIAGTGVDGGHIGYVIHAPELTLPDYPIARFEPMDGKFHGQVAAYPAFSSQNRMPMSRYSVVAVARCSCAFRSSPVRR